MNSELTTEKLVEHCGHKIVIVKYGTKGKDWNVSLECETCYALLADGDLV